MAVTVIKGKGTVLSGGRKLPIDVYRIKDVPGVFIFEMDSTDKGKGWTIAHDESGKLLSQDLIKNKNVAANAVNLYLKDVDLTQSYENLIKDPEFKKALVKIKAVSKTNIKPKKS